jgi:hypothetical protein
VERCLACQAEAPDDEGQVFDARRGGVVCGGCHGHGRPLPGEVRRAMAALQRATLEEAPALTLDRAVNDGVREATRALLVEHLARPLKSLEFIAKLNHA